MLMAIDAPLVVIGREYINGLLINLHCIHPYSLLPYNIVQAHTQTIDNSRIFYIVLIQGGSCKKARFLRAITLCYHK